MDVLSKSDLSDKPTDFQEVNFEGTVLKEIIAITIPVGFPKEVILRYELESNLAVNPLLLIKLKAFSWIKGLFNKPMIPEYEENKLPKKVELKDNIELRQDLNSVKEEKLGTQQNINSKSTLSVSIEKSLVSKEKIIKKTPLLDIPVKSKSLPKPNIIKTKKEEKIKEESFVKKSRKKPAEKKVTKHQLG